MKKFVHCQIDTKTRKPSMLPRAKVLKAERGPPSDANTKPGALPETNTDTAGLDAEDSQSEREYLIYTTPGNAFLGAFRFKYWAEFFAPAYDEFEDRRTARPALADGKKLGATRHQVESAEVVLLDVGGEHVGYLSGDVSLTAFGFEEAPAPNEVNEERAVEPASRSGGKPKI